LLHIDTEGHDNVILRSINFNKIVPSMILFEHKHFDGPFLMGPKYVDCCKYLELKDIRSFIKLPNAARIKIGFFPIAFLGSNYEKERIKEKK
jgi:hypothetical protein